MDPASLYKRMRKLIYTFAGLLFLHLFMFCRMTSSIPFTAFNTYPYICLKREEEKRGNRMKLPVGDLAVLSDQPHRTTWKTRRHVGILLFLTSHLAWPDSVISPWCRHSTILFMAILLFMFLTEASALHCTIAGTSTVGRCRSEISADFHIYFQPLGRRASNGNN